MSKPQQPVQPCAVCTKHKESECSHVLCPNRKPITASPPEAMQSIGGATGTYRVPPRTTH